MRAQRRGWLCGQHRRSLLDECNLGRSLNFPDNDLVAAAAHHTPDLVGTSEIGWPAPAAPYEFRVEDIVGPPRNDDQSRCRKFVICWNANAVRSIAGFKPNSPFRMDQLLRSLLRQNGPPGWTSRTIGLRPGWRNMRMPALRLTELLPTEPK